MPTRRYHHQPSSNTANIVEQRVYTSAQRFEFFIGKTIYKAYFVHFWCIFYKILLPLSIWLSYMLIYKDNLYLICIWFITTTKFLYTKLTPSYLFRTNKNYNFNGADGCVLRIHIPHMFPSSGYTIFSKVLFHKLGGWNRLSKANGSHSTSTSPPSSHSSSTQADNLKDCRWGTACRSTE